MFGKISGPFGAPLTGDGSSINEGDDCAIAKDDIRGKTIDPGAVVESISCDAWEVSRVVETLVFGLGFVAVAINAELPGSKRKVRLVVFQADVLNDVGIGKEREGLVDGGGRGVVAGSALDRVWRVVRQRSALDFLAGWLGHGGGGAFGGHVEVLIIEV